MTNPSEIKEIMDMLGRRIVEGQVKGSHLGQILTYLQQKKTESLKTTLSKLALICGMSKRNIRENYIEGIAEFGIIHTQTLSNDVVWNWYGVKAFEENNETFMNYVQRTKQKEEQEKEKEKEVKKNGKGIKKKENTK